MYSPMKQNPKIEVLTANYPIEIPIKNPEATDKTHVKEVSI